MVKSLFHELQMVAKSDVQLLIQISKSTRPPRTKMS
jgi:hypothetical protein